MAEMVFFVTADAPLQITQRCREQVLDAGDAIFLRGSERSVIESGGRTTFTNISVPIDELTPMLASGEDLSMATVSRHNGMLDLLVGSVRLLHTRPQPMSARFGPIASAHPPHMMVAAPEP